MREETQVSIESNSESFGGDLLDLVGRKVGNIVDNTNDLLSLVGVDVCQEPVIQDISLDAPGELQILLAIDEINQLSLWLFNSARSISECVMLITLGFGLGVRSINGKVKNLDSALKGSDRVRGISLDQRAWELAGVEAVSVGEHLSISANLEFQLSTTECIDIMR